MNIIADLDVWDRRSCVVDNYFKTPIDEEKPFEDQDLSEDSKYLIEDAETIENDYLQNFYMRHQRCTPSKIYVQVTNNCNMYCQHCCHNSGPENKDFMSMETFIAAIKWEPQAMLNFGGGEPTCHPLFWELMGVAIKERKKGRIWIATNGKRTEDALLLASLTKDGIIRGTLSQDKWHEPISQDVVDAFLHANNTGYNGTIRNVGKKKGPIRDGRCDWGNRLDCVGSDMPFVQPNGMVRQCACSNSPIVGNVFDGYKPMFPEAWGDPWKCAFGKQDTI
jgi:hypothetical protein